MPFKDNKYKLWYFALIKQAQNRTIELEEYYEKHHIIPKSLGGSDEISNILKLTMREHFICHLLLTKFTTGQSFYKMTKALTMLMNIKQIGDRNKLIINSHWYDYARKESKKAIEYLWTEERKKLQSKKFKEYFKIMKENPTEKYLNSNKKKSEWNKNKIWTETAIDNRLNNCLKAAASRKGKSWSKARREAYNENPTVFSEERKQRASLANKGKILSTGTSKSVWFQNPNGEEILIFPLNTLTKLYSISYSNIKKLLTGEISEYNGWKYLPGKLGEKLKTYKRKPNKNKNIIRKPRINRITIEIIIERSKKRHGDRYGYLKSIYVSGNTNMIITCNSHGDFFQTPDNHTYGAGCPLCARDEQSKKLSGTMETFLFKCKKVHGDTYSYDHSVYINDRTKLLITCKSHGDFLQTPNSHLQGHGCLECGKKHIVKE